MEEFYLLLAVAAVPLALYGLCLLAPRVYVYLEWRWKTRGMTEQEKFDWNQKRIKELFWR